MIILGNIFIVTGAMVFIWGTIFGIGCIIWENWNSPSSGWPFGLYLILIFCAFGSAFTIVGIKLKKSDKKPRDKQQ